MNKKKFKAKMALFGDNGETIARLLDKSRQSISAKINGQSDFTQGEICILKDHWNLSAEELDGIFFAPDESCQDGY